MDHTHVTAPTRFVERDGIRFAYRRFGQESGIPLLFFQHFRGGMDHWDPAVTDGFAQDRPVVLFDNAGVAGTSGDTPNSIEAMADHAATFVGALGLSQVDVLGFSIGGYVSTNPCVASPYARASHDSRGDRSARRRPVSGSERCGVCRIDGPRSPGRAASKPFYICSFAPLRRAKLPAERSGSVRHERKRDVDPPSTPQTMAAQRAAATEWRQIRGERFSELRDISQPTLVVNGTS